ncbi:hypothetical protein J6A31_04915 [bacterium]|nr:hypothetical protein [bacterium]
MTNYNKNKESLYDILLSCRFRTFDSMFKIENPDYSKPIIINTAHIISVKLFTPHNAITDTDFIKTLYEIEMNIKT